jgi:hypothetical protein
MSSGSGFHLLDMKGSSAVTCTVALDLARLRCITYPTALDPTSLQGRAPERRVSYNSGSCLPTGRALVLPPHALWFPVDHEPQA